MDANNAINLLNETFQNEFDLNQYQKFLRELFNTSNINVRNLTKFIKNEFAEYANSVLELGSYSDDLGDSIVFYVIELAKESSRDRARTMQRNLVSTFMRNQYDYALVAFYEPNSDDWRFSYVKIEYEFNEKGLKEKLSSPRRHSFLVGPNEPNYTCRKQLLPLMIAESKFNVSEIDNAFSIENVTDEFFNKYKKLFLQLTESLDEVKENDNAVKLEFDEKNIKSSDFAKKLMGQIVFIYFLQKKGWLGVEKDANWGTGPKNFFKIIFDKCVANGNNFFNDVLEPLFYEGFSEEVSDDHYSMFNYRVPFLNGGLFEPINNYNWVDTDIFLDNSIFKDVINTFNKFNFTVKEDEPLEKEVAVDPEMLGKVFENLLEIVDRKSKGAFYTPRHIVHYMCQESLISYLNTNSDIAEEDLRTFITKGELAINSIIRANEEKRKYNGNQYTHIELPDSIKENSGILENLLQKVKVIDPAVGSGAFPVGMMNEIVKARYILYLLAEYDDINLYDLKRETIENSLYGVDIELSATDVTKLRFWLSLIVDEENIEEIKPLPNLDNQIMCGNSLVDSYEGIRLFDDTLIRRSGQQKLMITPVERAFNDLENKKIEYFKTSGPKTKLKLKTEINELKWNFIEKQIENYNPKLIEDIRKYKYSQDKPFFVWELEFSEIFKGDNPGFDIVIGNPPYVGEKGNKDSFDLVKKTDLGKRFASGKMDYFYYFFHKGLDVCKTDGILSFITTNYFITADSALNLRNDIKDRTSIKQLINFNELKIFKSAMGQHNLITMLEKNQNPNCNSYNSITHRKGLFTDKILTDIFNRNDEQTDFFIINQNDIYEGDENYIRISGISGAKTGNEKNDKILTILNKIQDNGTKMSNICDVKTGLRSGIDKISNKHLKIDDSFAKGDEVFVVSEQFYNGAPEKDKKYIKPLFKNSDIKRYYNSEKTNKYVIYTDKNTNIDDLKYIKKHLLKYKSLIETIRKKDGEIWYSLVRPRENRIFTSPKIVIPQRSKFNDFSYTENDFYGSSDVYYIINKKGFEHINLKYVIALINSKLYYVWLYYKGKRKGDNLELYNTPLSNIYIPELPSDAQVPFIKFADELLELYSQYNLNKDNNIKEKIELIEDKLNQSVYSLFNLTDEEIEIIEDFFI